MEQILGFFGGGALDVLNQRNDDDFASRLSHKYSVSMCVVLALIVSSAQYVGEPITCWVPAHFSGPHEAYTNSYCWIQNTYYAPFNEYLPKAEEEHQMIPYYQWMPMILLIQALLFYLPIMLWRSLSSTSGMRIDSLIDGGTFYEQAENPKVSEQLMEGMTNMMDHVLNTQKIELKTKCTISLKHILSRTICACCGRRQGNYLTVLYLFTKAIFVAMVIGQIFLLNFLLGYPYHFYGIEVLRLLFNKEEWLASPHFPRVTMCDFKVRRLGNVHDYTVQCVLPINLFNEKIYLFLWFWLVFLSAVMVFSFLQWLTVSALRSSRIGYIRKQLGRAKKQVDPSRLDLFMDEYLRSDGVFMLHLFEKNLTAVTTTDLIGAMWDKFSDEEDQKLHID